MLRTLSAKTARSFVPRVEATLCSMQNFSSMSGLKGYDGKEQAEEAVFFHKEDEKLLKKLLSKVRAQAELNDSRNAKETRAAEMASLNDIVGSKLSDVEKEALLGWKHTNF